MVVPLTEMEEIGIRFESEFAIKFSIFGILGLRCLLDTGGVSNWYELKEGEGGQG